MHINGYPITLLRPITGTSANNLDPDLKRRLASVYIVCVKQNNKNKINNTSQKVKWLGSNGFAYFALSNFSMEHPPPPPPHPPPPPPKKKKKKNTVQT